MSRETLLDDAIAKAKEAEDWQLVEWLRMARGGESAARWYTEKLRDARRVERKLLNENTKLRELCATVIDDWMSKVCPSFPFCEFSGEYQDCTDETCGNQIYRQMARELGVEVE